MLIYAKSPGKNGNVHFECKNKKFIFAIPEKLCKNSFLSKKWHFDQKTQNRQLFLVNLGYGESLQNSPGPLIFTQKSRLISKKCQK